MGGQAQASVQRQYRLWIQLILRVVETVSGEDDRELERRARAVASRTLPIVQIGLETTEIRVKTQIATVIGGRHKQTLYNVTHPCEENLCDAHGGEHAAFSERS